MRRGSVVGPLLLIVFGVLFLMHNVRPDFSLLDIIGRSWPYLLIAWGVLRLIEIAILALRRKPLPVSGVSGGEWALIVFICIAGSGAFFASHAIGHWPPESFRVRGIEVFGEPFDYQLEEQRVPAGKAQRVIVENFRGNARIHGADVAEVTVAGRKTVRSLRQEEANEANRMTPLEVVNQGDTILVRTNQDRARVERYVTADLEITVPRGATIEVRGRYGDFDIMDIAGNVDVSSDNAGVRMHNIGGSALVDLRRSDIVRAIDVKGTVELRGRGSNVEMENIGGQVTITGAYSGELQFRNLAMPLRYDGPHAEMRVERLPGELRLTRGHVNGEDLVGPIVLNSRSKDVELSDFTNALELRLDRGDVELRPGRPVSKIDVQTHSGSIQLALPDKAQFVLRATAHRGEVQNEYGEPLEVETEGRGGQITGDIGGGPPVTLTTDRGEIVVRKAFGDFEPPKAPVPPLPRPPSDRATMSL
jgi:hypothetical protein